MSKLKTTNVTARLTIGAFPAIHPAISLGRVVSGAKLNLYQRRSLIIASSFGAGWPWSNSRGIEDAVG
jgi:hypothetical protein